MANFPTHIAIGTVVSGALATVTVAADMVAPENIVAVTLAGVLGSVLPDIDLKDSRPARAMFAGLGVFFSFAVLFSLERKYSIAEMLILWLGTLLFVRYVAKEIFFPFQLSPRSLALDTGADFLFPGDGLGLQQAAGPGRGSRVACCRVSGGRLSHAPHSGRALLGRRDGHPHQGVIRHGAEAVRLQAPRSLVGHGRGHCPRLSADTTNEDIRREHLGPSVCGPACISVCCLRTSGSAAWRG